MPGRRRRRTAGGGLRCVAAESLGLLIDFDRRADARDPLCLGAEQACSPSPRGPENGQAPAMERTGPGLLEALRVAWVGVLNAGQFSGAADRRSASFPAEPQSGTRSECIR